MDITKIADFLKLSSEHLLALLVFGLAVLGYLVLASDGTLELLGLRDFRSDYRTWLGLGLTFSMAMLLVREGKSLFHWGKSRIIYRRALRRRRERLHDLTPGERALLREYIEGQTRTEYFTLEDGVVQGLVAQVIIYQSANVGVGTTFAYNIQPWA